MLTAVSEEVSVHARPRPFLRFGRSLLFTAPLALAGCPELTPLEGVEGDLDGDGVVDAPVVDVGDPAGPLTADIDVDSNRDGVIDGSDDAREDAFDGSGGAVFFANVDDDDGDGDRDRNDAVLPQGNLDVEDLTIVRVRGINAPAFECRPYSLTYTFDAGLCR